MNFYGLSSKRRVATGEPITWTSRTSSFGTTAIFGIAYGDSTFVIVGNKDTGYCKIATSSNGITWSQSTGGAVADRLVCVDYDGTTWVTSGFGGGYIGTATNPAGAWTNRGQIAGNLTHNAIIYTQSTWVLASNDAAGAVYTSTSPTTTWTSRATASADDNYSLATDGTTILLGFYDGELNYATSPTGSWTNITSPFGANRVYGIGYGNGVWMAVTQNGEMARSTTGTSGWALVTDPFGTSHIRAVKYGNGAWVAVSDGGKLATSIDGTSWTLRTSGFDLSPIYNIIYANNIWVAIGESGKLSTAVSGT